MTVAHATPAAARPTDRQYTVRRVLAIWAAAALPMAVLAWAVWPALDDATNLHPGMLFWLLMVVGMVWQFALALTILYRELGTLRWSAVAPRVWAQQPRDPRTGRRSPRSWWALVPITAVFALLTLASEELTVFVDNAPAIALYRKFGFEVEGTHRAYAMRGGHFVDVLAMARLHPSPPAFP